MKAPTKTEEAARPVARSEPRGAPSPASTVSRPLILFGFTAAASVGFCSGQAAGLRRSGIEVAVVSSPGPQLDEFRLREDVPTIALPIEREIAPLRDAISLCRLVRLLHRMRPVLTVFGTPKAGLLGNIAARLTSVPCRVYMLHGLRFETTQGWKRRILVWATSLSCQCAHRVICVSPSLRQRAIELGLVAAQKAVVVASGTCNGVEVERFLPTTENLCRAEELRGALNLPHGVPVIGFVGRFTSDKGIADLFASYRELRKQFPGLRLLLVGDFDDGDPVPEAVRNEITRDANVIRPGFVADTSLYYHLMDLLVLPTAREGFPGVALEAQVAGKPVVTTTATGAIDAVQNGLTGFLVPAGNASELAQAIARLLADAGMRQAMGRRGQEWVSREFAGPRVREALLDEYRKLIRDHELRRRPGPQSGWRGRVKRGIDIVGAVAGLVLLFPVLAWVALGISISMGKPIFYRQTRPGFRGEPFSLLKFRTMRDAHDAEGLPLPDAQRLTRLGIWLRKLSLDELPQLWNVLRGDMSLVGPRPLLTRYSQYFTEDERRRFDVQPGITGLAQVHGRNNLRWDDRIAFDVSYVDHWSLWLDAKILRLTLWRVFRSDGVHVDPRTVMPDFDEERRSRQHV